MDAAHNVAIVLCMSEEMSSGLSRLSQLLLFFLHSVLHPHCCNLVTVSTHSRDASLIVNCCLHKKAFYYRVVYFYYSVPSQLLCLCHPTLLLILGNE